MHRRSRFTGKERRFSCDATDGLLVAQLSGGVSCFLQSQLLKHNAISASVNIRLLIDQLLFCMQPPKLAAAGLERLMSQSEKSYLFETTDTHCYKLTYDLTQSRHYTHHIPIRTTRFWLSKHPMSSILYSSFTTKVRWGERRATAIDWAEERAAPLSVYFDKSQNRVILKAWQFVFGTNLIMQPFI